MRPRLAVAVALAVLAGAALAAAQQNQAIGVSPDRVTVADAQPGESYVRTVTFQHQYDSPGTIRVEVDGPEAAWVTTQPASPFTMPARSNRQVEVTIAIPGGAGPGGHNTTLRFVRQADPTPGSSSVEVSAGVHLDIAVGGAPQPRIAYLSARVEDAHAGDPVHAFVLAENDGNVRATAQANGTVLPFAADSPTLSDAAGSLVLLPGEQGEVPLTFPAGLAVGQYRARLTAAGFDQTLPFKVAVGAAPDLALRALVHAPRGTARQPVPIDGWVTEQGKADVRAAVLHADVRKGSQVLATLESDPAAVAKGASANLTVTWTPPGPGTYTILAHATYDGYETMPNTSVLNVDPARAGDWLWLVLLLALLLAVVAILVAWRKRRKDEARAKGKAKR
jgi:hypothetical protein